jgi:hypothetical protein
MPSWTPQPQQNPYYSTGNPYGWAEGTSYQTTPIANIYRQIEPGVAWTVATSPYAGGLNPYARFVQGQEGRVEDAYKAAVATNPNLTRDQFFAGLQPQFQRMWAGLGPRGRQDQRGLYAPSARWQRWG